MGAWQGETGDDREVSVSTCEVRRSVMFAHASSRSLSPMAGRALPRSAACMAVVLLSTSPVSVGCQRQGEKVSIG